MNESAIGNYIHRSLQGYRAEGGDSPPYFNTATEAYKKKKAEINRQIKMEQIDKDLENQAKELENMLNEFLHQNSSFDAALKSEYKQQLQEFNDTVLMTEYPQYVAKYFLQVESKSIDNKKLTTKIDEINMNTNKPGIEIDRISKKLELINRNIKAATKKGRIGKNSIEELKKQYNDLQTMFNDIQTKLQENNPGIKSLNKKKNMEFFTQLNLLINKVEFSNELNYARGKTLELFVPFIVNHINQTVKNKIAFTISKQQGGKDSKSLPGLSQANFAQNIDLTQVIGTKAGKTIEDKNAKFIASIKIPTEEKVDFYLAVGGKDIGFSAKNYAVNSPDFSGISLVTGQSLLTLLQNENDENFVNHYLTLIQPLDTEDVQNGQQRIKTHQFWYNKLVYQLILLKALTGYNVLKYDTDKNNLITTDTAQFLIINDSAAGKNNNIKVLSTKRLINKILETFNSIGTANPVSLSIGSKTGYDYNSFASFTLQSDPYDINGWTVEKRITDILIKAHAQKIHMSLKANFIKKTIFGYNTTTSSKT